MPALVSPGLIKPTYFPRFQVEPGNAFQEVLPPFFEQAATSEAVRYAALTHPTITTITSEREIHASTHRITNE